MINRLIGGFVSILIGVSLVNPVAGQVAQCAARNTSGTALTSYHTCYEALVNVSAWGTTVIALVPGFFALGVLGIGLAVAYGALQDAGVL